MLRNTDENKKFIERWLFLVQDWHLLTDEPSILPNTQKFIENRHDQSFLSMLTKKYKRGKLRYKVSWRNEGHFFY